MIKSSLKLTSVTIMNFIYLNLPVISLEGDADNMDTNVNTFTGLIIKNVYRC